MYRQAYKASPFHSREGEREGKRMFVFRTPKALGGVINKMTHGEVIKEEDKDKVIEKKMRAGVVKATGLKSVQVKAKDTMSIRGQVIDEMRENRDSFFPDRCFCDKYGVSNQQINQLMRQLERNGSIERVCPQCADPYHQLPDGKRIMNRWTGN